MGRKDHVDDSYTATATSEDTKQGTRSTISDKEKSKMQQSPMASKPPSPVKRSPEVSKNAKEIPKNSKDVKAEPKHIVQKSPASTKEKIPDKKGQIANVPKKSSSVKESQPRKKSAEVLQSAKSVPVSVKSVKSSRPSSRKEPAKNAYVKMTPRKTDSPAQTPYVKISPKGTTPFGGSVIEDAEPKARRPKFRKYEQDGGSWSTGFRLTIAGLALLALILIGFFVFLIYSHLLPTKEYDLPDLTDLCQQVQLETRPLADIRCFYHANKYPVNCSYSSCSSVMLKAHVQKTKLSIIRATYSTLPASEFNHLTDGIPDHTPCADYSWCTKRTCKKVDDPRIKKYTESKKVNGNWELQCGAECISYSQDDNPDDTFAAHDELEKSKSCSKRIQCDSPKKSLFEPEIYAQFGIKTCTNPLPKYGGSVCWLNDTKNLNPIQIVKICGKCDHPYLNNSTCKFVSDTYEHYCVVSCGETWYVLPNGSACRHGYCFQGYCISVTNPTTSFCISRP